MNRALIIGALVAVSVVFARPAFSASPSSRATAFVRDLSTEAVQVLSSDGAGLAEREAKFQTLLSSRFDVRVIGRFALGRYWRQASTAQRKEYLELFGDYIVKTYSTKLGGYSGHQFTIVSERALDNKTDTLVNSRIERPSGRLSMSPGGFVSTITTNELLMSWSKASAWPCRNVNNSHPLSANMGSRAFWRRCGRGPPS